MQQMLLCFNKMKLVGLFSILLFGSNALYGTSIQLDNFDGQNQSVDVLYDFSEGDVAGFQFNITGLSMTSASGGAAEEAGFNVAVGPLTTLGFSFTGATIPAGSGLLTRLYFSEILSDEACIEMGDGAITATGGLDYDVSITGSCLSTIEEGPTTVDVLFNSDIDIYGFQFDVEGGTVSAASGGAAEAANFSVSAASSVVLGFSFTGAFIPAGEGVLTTLVFEGEDPCLTNLILSGQGGVSVNGEEILDCFTISYTEPCADADDDSICDDVDSCIGLEDCSGECNGDATEDCNNECGGQAVLDECGVCAGDNSSCLSQCSDDDLLFLDNTNSWSVDQGDPQDNSSVILGAMWNCLWSSFTPGGITSCIENDFGWADRKSVV